MIVKKNEEIITNVEPIVDSVVINKAYIDEKSKKIDGHVSYLENDYNENKLQYNKQSVEDILIQRAVKTTIQILHENGLFDIFQNANKAFEDFFFNKMQR